MPHVASPPPLRQAMWILFMICWSYSQPALCSVLVTAKAEDADLDTSLTATSPSVWQLESDVVKQQQGHHKSYNQGIGHTSQSFPLPLLHAADSNEAGISGTLTGASDSRSDNIINESRLPPHLHLPEQLHRPALSGATDSAGYGSTFVVAKAFACKFLLHGKVVQLTMRLMLLTPK